MSRLNFNTAVVMKLTILFITLLPSAYAASISPNATISADGGSELGISLARSSGDVIVDVLGPMGDYKSSSANDGYAVTLDEEGAWKLLIKPMSSTVNYSIVLNLTDGGVEKSYSDSRSVSTQQTYYINVSTLPSSALSNISPAPVKAGTDLVISLLNRSGDYLTGTTLDLTQNENNDVYINVYSPSGIKSSAVDDSYSMTFDEPGLWRVEVKEVGSGWADDAVFSVGFAFSDSSGMAKYLTRNGSVRQRDAQPGAVNYYFNVSESTEPLLTKALPAPAKAGADLVISLLNRSGDYKTGTNPDITGDANNVYINTYSPSGVYKSSSVDDSYAVTLDEPGIWRVEVKDTGINWADDTGFRVSFVIVHPSGTINYYNRSASVRQRDSPSGAVSYYFNVSQPAEPMLTNVSPASAKAGTDLVIVLLNRSGDYKYDWQPDTAGDANDVFINVYGPNGSYKSSSVDDGYAVTLDESGVWRVEIREAGAYWARDTGFKVKFAVTEINGTVKHYDRSGSVRDRDSLSGALNYYFNVSGINGSMLTQESPAAAKYSTELIITVNERSGDYRYDRDVDNDNNVYINVYLPNGTLKNSSLNSGYSTKLSEFGKWRIEVKEAGGGWTEDTRLNLTFGVVDPQTNLRREYVRTLSVRDGPPSGNRSYYFEVSVEEIPTYATSLAISTLARVGEKAAAQSGARWLESKQNADGSWNDTLRSSAAATSSAIYALISSGVSKGNESVQNGLAFLNAKTPADYFESGWKLKGILRAGMYPESQGVNKTVVYLNAYSSGTAEPFVVQSLVEYLRSSSFSLYNGGYTISLNQNEGGETKANVTIPAEAPPGQYIAEGNLVSGIELAEDSSKFSITIGEAIAKAETLGMYAFGDSVSVNYSVEKISGASWSNAVLTLEILGASNEVAANQSISLAAGEKKSFAATYLPFKAGNYSAVVRLSHNGEEKALAAASFRVVKPEAGVAIQTDKETYLEGESGTARVTSSNVGEVPFYALLSVNGNSSSINLSVDDSQQFAYSFKAVKGMNITANLTKGNWTLASKTLGIAALSENLSASASVEKNAGVGEVFFATFYLNNTGEADSVVTLAVTFENEPSNYTQLIKKGENGTITIGLAPDTTGDHILTYALTTSSGKTVLAGTENVKVSSFVRNISISSASLAGTVKVGGNISLAVDLSNLGYKDVEGKLEASIKGEAEIARTEAAFNLSAFSNKSLSFNLSLPKIPAGNYSLEIRAYYADGMEADSRLLNFSIAPGSVRVVSVTLDKQEYAPGESATVVLALENIGGAEAGAAINLGASGIFEDSGDVYIEAGESKTLNISFVIPEDLGASSYEIEYLINKARGILNLSVLGADIKAEVSTDKEFYLPNETVSMRISVYNAGRASLTDAWAKVQMVDFEFVVKFNTSADERKDLQVAMKAPENTQKVSWGIYQSSGRALLLGDKHVAVKPSRAVFLRTERGIYDAGESALLYAEVASPIYLENATLEISSEMFSASETFSGYAKALQYSFPIPQNAQSGSYEISYKLTAANFSEFGSFYLDARGYSAKFLEAKLDKNLYPPGESAALTLEVENAGIRSFDGEIRLWIYDASGIVSSASKPISLSVGERKEISFNFSTGATPGMGYVAYSIVYDGNTLAGGNGGIRRQGSNFNRSENWQASVRSERACRSSCRRLRF